MTLEIPEYPRLTLQRALKTINDTPGLRLAPGAWMTKEKGGHSVCAVGLLAVSLKGLTRAGKMRLSAYDEVGRELGVPEDYLHGLEAGYEVRWYKYTNSRTENDDNYRGEIHGAILRYATEPEGSPLLDHLERSLGAGGVFEDG